MSKARDIANAGTALTSVSATELAYLDGVTSAVQTQINAKQAVVSGVNDTEIGYLDGVTSAIQTQIDSKIGQSTAINPTIVDAKGDIIAATASDTVARLAVGSNGTVLTADSAETTGLKWVSSAPPATNFTLVGTVSLSGTNIYTISGISGANQLLIMFDDTTVQQSSFLTLRFNGDTAQNYRYVGPNIVNNGSWTLSTTGVWRNINSDSDKISIARTSISTGSNAAGYLFVDGCNSLGVKTFHGAGGATQDGSSTTQYNWIGGYWNNTSTISSVSILNSTLNFSSGTMRVYKA